MEVHSKPSTIVVGKLNYSANAALHVVGNLLSCRLCQRQLWCKVASGEISLPFLFLGLAAESAHPVAATNSLPGHTADLWPADTFIAAVYFDEQLSPFVYDTQPRYEDSRGDAGIYRLVNREEPPTHANLELRIQRHPVRGALARQRWIRVIRNWADKKRARAASGLFWDDWNSEKARLIYNNPCYIK